jgi:hypothetical protein
MADRFHTPKEIASNATTLISTNPGAVLHSVAINDPGSSWQIAVYSDTTQTTRIAAIKPATIGTIFYDAVCSGGISVVSSGTTPGSITVAFS